jgi:hypothetical protein
MHGLLAGTTPWQPVSLGTVATRPVYLNDASGLASGGCQGNSSSLIVEPEKCHQLVRGQLSTKVGICISHALLVTSRPWRRASQLAVKA